MTVQTQTADAAALEPAAIPSADDGIVRAAIWLTLGLLAVRLLTIGEFGLFLDEAYYWVWSQHLAASYYDHPPLVALMIRASTFLFGDGPFGVRALGAVSIAVDAMLVYAIGRTLLGSRRAAAWGAIFFNVSILAGIGMIVVPDQPMMVFWLGALYGVARIARGGSGAWWLFVGLMVGLTGLAKYTALFLGLGIVLWLVLVPSQRRWLKSPMPYLGALVALAVFSPVLVWNAENGWSSFALQLDRTAYEFESLQWRGFVQFLVLLVLMAGPPVFILAATGAVSVLRRGWRLDPGLALLIVTALPLPLYLAVHSFSEWIGGHWLAPVLANGALLAAYGMRHESRQGFGRIVTLARRTAVPVGLAVATLFAVLFSQNVISLGRDLDVTARFRGWEEFAADADRIRREAGAAYFVAADYGTVSWLRYNLRESVPVYQVGEWERWSELTPPDPSLAAETALYVGRYGQSYERKVAESYFADVGEANYVARPIRGDWVETSPAFLVKAPLPTASPLFATAAAE
ncbi:MAG: glycosyltransferase family 39 protein [Bauldia sp.]|nr:glycosyltransferase family 39 protein [Bauldia sp.]